MSEKQKDGTGATSKSSRLPRPLAADLEARHLELQDLVERFTLTADVSAAIARGSRMRSFIDRSEGLWGTLAGEAGNQIVDLASWLKGMHDHGGTHHEAGLLRLVAADGKARSALGKKWPGADAETTKSRENAFHRLFPWGETDVPSEGDLTVLVAKVGADAEPVRLARNVHHAHRFETAKSKKARAVNHVELDDLRRHLERATSVSADLISLTCNVSWPIHLRTADPARGPASDIADLILLGALPLIVHDHTSSAAAGEFYSQTRPRLYDRLQSRFEAAGAPEDRAFNDPVYEIGAGAGS